MDVFDKIYYINLDKRGDRDREFQRDVAIYGNIERISGIDGTDIEKGLAPRNLELKKLLNNWLSVYKDKSTKREYKSPMMYGEIGLSLTYYNLWTYIVQDQTLSDDSLVLVLEDDVKLCKHFFHSLHAQRRQIHTNRHTLGIFYLGGRRQRDFMPPNRVLKDFTPFPSINTPAQLYLRPNSYKRGQWYDRETHSIAYTKATIRKILDCVDDTFLLQPIDLFLMGLSRKGLIISELLPHVCYSLQRADTDIQKSTKIKVGG